MISGHLGDAVFNNKDNLMLAGSSTVRSYSTADLGSITSVTLSIPIKYDRWCFYEVDFKFEIDDTNLLKKLFKLIERGLAVHYLTKNLHQILVESRVCDTLFTSPEGPTVGSWLQGSSSWAITLYDPIIKCKHFSEGKD